MKTLLLMMVIIAVVSCVDQRPWEDRAQEWLNQVDDVNQRLDSVAAYQLMAGNAMSSSDCSEIRGLASTGDRLDNEGDRVWEEVQTSDEYRHIWGAPDPPIVQLLNRVSRVNRDVHQAWDRLQSIGMC